MLGQGDTPTSGGHSTTTPPSSPPPSARVSSSPTPPQPQPQLQQPQPAAAAPLPSPRLRELPGLWEVAVSQIAAGEAHVVALVWGGGDGGVAGGGRVFTWGRGRHGALGHCDFEDCHAPRQVGEKGVYVPACVWGGGGGRRAEAVCPELRERDKPRPA